MRHRADISLAIRQKSLYGNTPSGLIDPWPQKFGTVLQGVGGRISIRPSIRRIHILPPTRRFDSSLSQTLLIGVLAFGYFTTPCKCEDRTKTKLDAAKDRYLKDIQKANKPVTEWFDKQEAAASRAGNKPRLDQIKAQRAAFFEDGKPCENLPAGLSKPYVTARGEVEAALVAAVKEYTKNKMDTESIAVLSELTEVKKNPSVVLPITTEDHFPSESIWTGTLTLNRPDQARIPCRFSMVSRDTYTFQGVFEILGNGDAHHVRTVRGVVSGHVFSWQAKQAKAEPGQPGFDTIAAFENDAITFKSAECTAVMKREPPAK